MPAADIQTSFAAGEISPQLYARVDLEKFQVGAALLRNFFVDYRGGVSNRPGTKYIATTKFPQGTQRLLPFIVSTEATYVLEFGEHYIRFYNLGVQLEVSPGVPYEVTTPYAAADLQRLNYTQSADVLTLVHPSYPPANLSRLTDTTFAYAVLTTAPDVDPPVLTTFVAPHSGPYSFGYLITSVDLDGKEESLASNPGVKHSEGMNETTNRVIGMSWTAPAQAVSKYNVYKWGPIDSVTLNPATVWGFIGSSRTTTFTDNNIAPDFSKQPPGWGDPFSGGQFQSIIVNASGSGYDGVAGDWPTAVPYVPLVITGDGTDAAGYAVVDHALGTIIGVYLTNPGKGYTDATVTANGQGGTGATFTYTFSNILPLNPACTAYLQQRRWFAGSNLKPETLVASQIGLYNNFNTTPVSLATDALIISLASEQVNTVRAMVPVSYGMLVFTTGGSFLLSGGSPNAPITPTTVSVAAQASEGANFLRPLSINYDVLYGQAKGNRIRNLAFAWQRQSYTGSDVTSLAPHLFDGFTTNEWTWAEEPFKIVWAVRDDGTLLSLTYVPDQEVQAWARHDTQGLFKSICSVPEGNTDAVYVIVQRHIDQGGNTPCWVNYIERFAERLGCCIYDSWFLDSALDIPKTFINTPLYLSGTTGNITITSYDPCLPNPGGGPFIAASPDTFLMEAKENYNPAIAAQADDGTFTTPTFTDTHLLGLAYDATRRELVYTALIVPAPYNAGTGLSTNATGHILWDGVSQIASGATFLGEKILNYNLARKNIDTGVVTYYPSYNVANTVPTGIGGGDGTWRRYVNDCSFRDMYPILTDPRNSNAWVHVQSCELHQFQTSDNWTQTISPLISSIAHDNDIVPIGMEMTWVYAVEIPTAGGFTGRKLHLTPRVRTVAETTVDYLLAYATYDFPAGWENRFARTAVDGDGNILIFSCAQTGTSDFKLHKFTKPSAFVYPTPPVDGGFTDVTPWAAGTGPNAQAAGATLVSFNGPARMSAFFNSGRTYINLLSSVYTDDFSPYNDQNSTVTHTWYNTTTHAWGSTVIARGLMTAAFVPTTNLAAAAYVISDQAVLVTNSYLQNDNFYANTEYLSQWLYFQAYTVTAGVVDYSNTRRLLVKLTWNDGAAPTVAAVVDEQGWDTVYAAYGTAIGNSQVVNATILPEPLTFDTGSDAGVFDAATSAFWWSGMMDAGPNPGSNMFKLDPTFTPRASVPGAMPPILKLAHGTTTPNINPLDCIHIGCGEIVVTEVVNSTTLHGTVEHPLDDISLPDDPAAAVAPVPAGTWWLTVPTQVFTGLEHLNEKEVWALADGQVMGPYTVDAGQVTLDSPASSVVVGLKYTQQIQTLYLTMEGLNQGTEQGKRKQISGITLRVDCTLGPLVGSDFELMYTPPELDPTNGVLFTGDSRAINFTKWDDKGEVCVQQNAPLPVSVNGIIVEVTPGDTGR